MEEYPRMLTPDSEPFDPIKLAKQTADIVCDGEKRKYTDFYSTGVYGGMSTAYTVGCNLRCIFCWVGPGRERPESYGEPRSPERVVEKLVGNAEREGYKKLRISGGEPTLCKQHLLKTLRLVSETDYLFVLETNGMLIGWDEEYPSQILEALPDVYIRISLKAGTPEGLRKRCGAREKSFRYPYKAIEKLLDEGADLRVASMSDPRLMPREEKQKMIEKLEEVGYTDYLEEERCDPYQLTIARLKAAGRFEEVFEKK